MNEAALATSSFSSTARQPLLEGKEALELGGKKMYSFTSAATTNKVKSSSPPVPIRSSRRQDSFFSTRTSSSNQLHKGRGGTTGTSSSSTAKFQLLRKSSEDLFFRGSTLLLEGYSAEDEEERAGAKERNCFDLLGRGRDTAVDDLVLVPVENVRSRPTLSTDPKEQTREHCSSSEGKATGSSPSCSSGRKSFSNTAALSPGLCRQDMHLRSSPMRKTKSSSSLHLVDYCTTFEDLQCDDDFVQLVFQQEERNDHENNLYDYVGGSKTDTSKARTFRPARDDPSRSGGNLLSMKQLSSTASSTTPRRTYDRSTQLLVHEDDTGGPPDSNLRPQNNGTEPTTHFHPDHFAHDFAGASTDQEDGGPFRGDPTGNTASRRTKPLSSSASCDYAFWVLLILIGFWMAFLS
ncbi:unnamed protein product, partial [Amoebophrya sp. A120]|eukprot:GSA120T00009358001.1